MNSITFFKNTRFYNEFYYQKTSVFTVFLKNGPIWDLCFFKNIRFYNEFGIFLSACFKNIGFYNEFCMLFAQDETKTYLCSKTSVFTMNYAHFFKNISFYNKKSPFPNLLCWLLPASSRLAHRSQGQHKSLLPASPAQQPGLPAWIPRLIKNLMFFNVFSSRTPKT